MEILLHFVCIETLRVCGKRKYPFIVDLTNFSLQFLQHFFKAVAVAISLVAFAGDCLLSGDEFLEKLQPSETRQNKTIKKQTFSLSTRHSDEAETERGRETGGQATRECHYSVGDIICPSTRAAFLPPATLPCTLTMATPPSGYALNFWLALPYPNWLTTHKQTVPSPLRPLLLLSASLHVAAYTWGLKLLWLSCNFTGWQWQ